MRKTSLVYRCSSGHPAESWLLPEWVGPCFHVHFVQELGESYHESSFYQALRESGTLGTVMVSLGRVQNYQVMNSDEK